MEKKKVQSGCVSPAAILFKAAALVLENPAESVSLGRRGRALQNRKGSSVQRYGSFWTSPFCLKKFCDLSAVDHSCKIPVRGFDDTDGEKEQQQDRSDLVEFPPGDLFV